MVSSQTQNVRSAGMRRGRPKRPVAVVNYFTIEMTTGRDCELPRIRPSRHSRAVHRGNRRAKPMQSYIGADDRPLALDLQSGDMPSTPSAGDPMKPPPRPQVLAKQKSTLGWIALIVCIIVGLIFACMPGALGVDPSAARSRSPVCTDTDAPSLINKPQIQTVDRTWKRNPAPPPGTSTPDPVGKLGLPNYNSGSLSDEEARDVYAHGELRMRELNDQLIKQGLSAEERAKIMFDQRNSLRSWVRDLMRDRAEAADITAKNPNLTWAEIVAQRRARGLEGDALYDSIIESSTRSRTSVNDALGIDPQHPSPLPPVLPSAPIEGAGPPSAAPGTGPHHQPAS